MSWQVGTERGGTTGERWGGGGGGGYEGRGGVFWCKLPPHLWTVFPLGRHPVEGGAGCWRSDRAY